MAPWRLPHPAHVQAPQRVAPQNREDLTSLIPSEQDIGAGATGDILSARWGTLSGHFSGVLDELRCIHALLDTLVRADRHHDTVRDTVTIGAPLAAAGGNSYIIRTRGYRHNRIFVGAAGNISVLVLGSPLSLAVNAGWNALDMPEGTELTVAATPINAVIEYTDEPVM